MESNLRRWTVKAAEKGENESPVEFDDFDLFFFFIFLLIFMVLVISGNGFVTPKKKKKGKWIRWDYQRV